MKRVSAQITDEKGQIRTVSIMLEEETAAALAQCSEEIRSFYILEELKAENQERAETRRHISYDSFTENGLDIPSPLEEPTDRVIRLEANEQLYRAMEHLTEKQYRVLRLVAVDGLSFRQARDLLGIRNEAVGKHYMRALQKLRKHFGESKLEKCAEFRE